MQGAFFQAKGKQISNISWAHINNHLQELIGFSCRVLGKQRFSGPEGPVRMAFFGIFVPSFDASLLFWVFFPQEIHKFHYFQLSLLTASYIFELNSSFKTLAVFLPTLKSPLMSRPVWPIPAGPLWMVLSKKAMMRTVGSIFKRNKPSLSAM